MGVPVQKKRILFVDDSALLRDMYESLLAGVGGHWQAATAPSGEAALELLKQHSFDAVASDMRMDGMNGVELLTSVAKLYPHTSRIIISGVADQAAAADALGSTHQFLVKPIDYDTFKATIARLDGLDAFLNDEKLKSLAGRMRALPSFPLLYLEIMKAVESPDSSLQEIDNLLIKDPAMTAKILQIVNSAAMGLRQKISSPMEAVQQLGLNTVRSLALSAHVFKSFTPMQKLNFPMDALWTHLMKCANTARAIMRVENADSTYVEAAYTAGMLHDIGKLMLADSLPKEFQTALTEAASRNAPFPEIEIEIFGATHAGLAAYLLGLWGLPAIIVEAVAFHHSPERSSLQSFSPLTAVHVANALEHEMDGDISNLNFEYLKKIGVADRLEVWRKEARKLRDDGWSS
jgi:HD-like signal output (HDOD) protein